MTELKSLIRTIPDYPKPGIQFRDITTLIKDAQGFKTTIDLLVQRYTDQAITKVVGTEARGFIFGAPLAYALGVGFVPVRKKGKLPGKTTAHEYALEYGHDRIEMHDDAIDANDRVLVVDDLLATGGTAAATVMLVRGMGGSIVECAFVIDLPDLGGRAKLEKMGLTVHTLVAFDGD
jgi:adenine phosphoribosyltransferase